jgi:peptidyl-prolyl cis-trans isomerase SurA
MVPEFERAYLALPVGQLSQPVRSPFGWHLILVDGTRQQDIGDARQRAEIRQELRARKSEQVYAEWLQQLRASAYVSERLQDQ